jgi:hypothetical protein
MWSLGVVEIVRRREIRVGSGDYVWIYVVMVERRRRPQRGDRRARRTSLVKSLILEILRQRTQVWPCIVTVVPPSYRCRMGEHGGLCGSGGRRRRGTGVLNANTRITLVRRRSVFHQARRKRNRGEEGGKEVLL